MTDQQRRLQGCFDVFHGAMALLRDECEEYPEAMVIVDDLEVHLLSRVRKLRHLLGVPYDREESDEAPADIP